MFALRSTRRSHSIRRYLSSISHTVDRYGAVHIDLAKQSLPHSEFVNAFDASLPKWLAEGRKAVWIQIPSAQASLIPAFVKHDFIFHHTDPHTLIMSKWLSNEKNMLPGYATTNLGIGAFVVNEKREALVILEKFSHAPNFWKLPGGTVDLDEELYTAAEREVKEETGVDATFQSIVAFRHMHAFRFGRGDIYNICVMTAKQADQKLIPQAEEIAQVRWAPLSEVFAFTHLKGWMPLVQSAVEREVDRLFTPSSNQRAAGMQPTRVPRLVGARWPGETAAFYCLK